MTGLFEFGVKRDGVKLMDCGGSCDAFPTHGLNSDVFTPCSSPKICPCLDCWVVTILVPAQLRSYLLQRAQANIISPLLYSLLWKLHTHWIMSNSSENQSCHDHMFYGGCLSCSAGNRWLPILLKSPFFLNYESASLIDHILDISFLLWALLQGSSSGACVILPCTHTTPFSQFLLKGFKEGGPPPRPTVSEVVTQQACVYILKFS